MGFLITTDITTGFTQIPNEFIHKYMPTANGNFVKVYLYLLMACQNKNDFSEITVSSLADRMECTENDIIRALRYWSKSGLVSIQEENDTIISVSLLLQHFQSGNNPESKETKTSVIDKDAFLNDTSIPVSAAMELETTTEPTVNIEIPAKQSYTPLQAEALQKDIEIDGAIATVEKLLGEPVSPSHLQIILYFMCDIGFSSDLLVTLYATAISKGKKQPSYIEAIGINWAKKGITSAQEAEDDAANFSGKYNLVAKALGINRNLAPSEKTIIDSWNSYQFSDSVINEACKRTVLQTGDTNFNYISKILEGWHKKNVISLQDIAKLDETYKRQKKNNGAKNNNVKKNGTTKNQFQNFPQRSYSKGDYDSLEKQLLRN